MASEYVQRQIEESSGNMFSSPMAEQNVLFQMFKKPKSVVPEVLDALEPKDFADLNLARIYKAIQEVVAKDQQVDLVNVDSMFCLLFPNHAKELTQRLIDVAQFQPGACAHEDIKDHIAIVKELSRRRSAIAKVDALAKGLRDPTKDLSEALSEISDVADVDDGNDAEWVPLNDVNMSTYEYLEKRVSGEIKAITTGIRSVDELTGGLFGGELTIVAARPSVGKSAFGLNLAMKAAKEGFRVGFVSCEMDDHGFGQRTLSRESFVNGDKLRKAQITPEDWDHLSAAITAMDTMPVTFMFNRSGGKRITVERVFRAVKKAVRRGEMDALVVDYIGIMQTERVFREERLRIAWISSELKRLAMAVNIPVVALCQVNRMAQGRMPTMAELRDSGAVEQDADIIIFLHRPESHDDKSVHPKDVKAFYAMQEGGSAYLAISVAKQRNGSTGITQVMFDPGVMRYAEIMRE